MFIFYFHYFFDKYNVRKEIKVDLCRSQSWSNIISHFFFLKLEQFRLFCLRHPFTLLRFKRSFISWTGYADNLWNPNADERPPFILRYGKCKRKQELEPVSYFISVYKNIFLLCRGITSFPIHTHFALNFLQIWIISIITFTPMTNKDLWWFFLKSFMMKRKLWYTYLCLNFYELWTFGI